MRFELLWYNRINFPSTAVLKKLNDFLFQWNGELTYKSELILNKPDIQIYLNESIL